MIEHPKLYVPYHNGLLDGAVNTSGVTSAIEHEATHHRNSMERVTFFSIDSHSGTYHGAKVLHVDPDTSGRENTPLGRRLWDYWVTIFQESYLAPTMPQEALDRMYLGEYTAPIGSDACLVQHIVQHGPDQAVYDEFTRRFERRFHEIEPHSVVNFQGLFWMDVMMEHGPRLRDQGCHLTCFVHEGISRNFSLTRKGVDMLKGLSVLDSVHVHTDYFASSLESQLVEAGLPVPSIRRFDIGVDVDAIRNAVRTITPNNFTNTVPGFWELPPGQKEFLTELFGRIARQKHVFFCVDSRMDPTKGIDEVLKGVDIFLSERVAVEGYDAVREKYGFFFINQGIDKTVNEPFNLTHQYGLWMEEQFQHILQKWDGIVFRARAFAGPLRPTMLAAMRGATVITGGRGEGKHLGGMEGLVANEGLPAAIIVPTGAGFGRQAFDKGYGDSGFFPDPGNPTVFANALHSIVTRKESHPGELSKWSRALTDDLVLPSNSSVLFDY